MATPQDQHQELLTFCLRAVQSRLRGRSGLDGIHDAEDIAIAVYQKVVEATKGEIASTLIDARSEHGHGHGPGLVWCIARREVFDRFRSADKHRLHRAAAGAYESCPDEFLYDPWRFLEAEDDANYWFDLIEGNLAEGPKQVFQILRSRQLLPGEHAVAPLIAKELNKTAAAVRMDFQRIRECAGAVKGDHFRRRRDFLKRNPTEKNLDALLAYAGESSKAEVYLAHGDAIQHVFPKLYLNHALSMLRQHSAGAGRMPNLSPPPRLLHKIRYHFVEWSRSRRYAGEHENAAQSISQPCLTANTPDHPVLETFVAFFVPDRCSDLRPDLAVSMRRSVLERGISQANGKHAAIVFARSAAGQLLAGNFKETAALIGEGMERLNKVVCPGDDTFVSYMIRELIGMHCFSDE